MKILILSYFDHFYGPKIFLKAPELTDGENFEQFPTLMNLYDNGFFVHISGGIKSANLIFESPSQYARGNRERLLISLLIEEGKEDINIDFTKELLEGFANEFNKINDVYKAFYINSSMHKGDQKKIKKIRNLLFTFYKSLKPAIEALRKAELRYRALFKAARDAILIIDRKSGIIIDGNEQAEKLFQRPSKDIIGQFSYELHAAADYDKVKQKILRQVNLKNAPPFEAYIKSTGGKQIPVEINANEIELKRKDLILCIFRDITERKLAEQNLRKKVKFEETISQLSSRFVGIFDFDEAINIALGDIGKLTNANRSYIFLANDEKTYFCNTYEWCKEGISPQIQNLKNVPVAQFDKIWYEKLKQGQVLINEASNLRKKDKFLKNILRAQNIKSILSVPIIIKDGEFSAFIGIDCVERVKEEDFALLKVASEIIGNVIIRKQAEEEIRESEEKYRLISENAYDMITVLNDKFEYEYINEQRYFNTLGFSNEDLIGKSALTFVHPEDINLSSRKLREGFEIGEGSDELRFRNKEGNYIWIEVKGRTFIDKDKKKKALIISRDVSERKLAEQKLKASEEKYRNMINNLDLGFFKTDANGIILAHNPSLNKILGFSPSESLVGFNGPDFWENPEDAKNYINNLLKTGTLRNYIHKAKKKDGEIIILQVDSHIIRNKENTTIEFEGTVFDVTEKFILEQKLKESEEKNRDLINRISDLLLEVDINGKITYASPQIYDIFGFTFDEIRNKRINKFIHPDDIFKVIEAMKEGFETRENVTIEYRTLHKNGHYINASAKGSFMDNGRFYGVVRDITERKKAEQRLKESEQKFKSVYKGILVPTYTWQKENKDLVLVDHNNAAEIISEGKIKNLLGIKASNLYGDQPEILKELYRCVNEKVNISREMNYCFKSTGKERYLKTMYSFVPPDLVLVQTEDITGRKLAEQKLKESEKKYRHLFESSPYFIGLVDMKGNLIDCNMSINKFMSLHKKQDVVGKSFREILSLNEKNRYLIPIFTKFFKETLQGDKVEPYEFEIFRTISDSLWLRIEGSLIEIQDKKVLQFIIQDITDRKKAEIKLKDSEEKYRNLLETSPIGIFDLNLKTMNIDYVNPKFLEIVGYTLDELNEQEIVISNFDLNDDGDLEFEFCDKKGNRKWLSGAKVYQYDKFGYLESVRLWVEDISEKKELEQKIKIISKQKN